jgi:hypothetical protein
MWETKDSEVKKNTCQNRKHEDELTTTDQITAKAATATVRPWARVVWALKPFKNEKKTQNESSEAYLLQRES